MTYDPGTDSVTTENNLTPDEQDSLEVGTEMQNQQEGLLAGKYKDAQELEKAYAELEAKLGQNETKDSTEAKEEEVLPEESEESTEEPSEAATLITSASEEFAESGNLTPETLEKFNQMSSKDLVEAYMKVQASLPDDSNEGGVDITTAAVNEVKNFAGGEKAYQSIVNWASENLDQGSIQAFDNIIGTGDVSAIKLAVDGASSISSLFMS